MPIISLRIPQLGEGLQEARLVATLKAPGETVSRDEPLYQMETDKAVMDIESPYDGVLAEWLIKVDSIVPIGSEIARMDVADGVQEAPATPHHAPHGTPTSHPTASAPPASAPAASNRLIPPRTRAYAKEKGVADEVLSTIPSETNKLMPSDIDAFLASSAAPAPRPAKKNGRSYTEREISAHQHLLMVRLERGCQQVVQGSISATANWEPIQALKDRLTREGGEFQPSVFTMFAYATTQALKNAPKFRSTLVNDTTLRTYDHVALGVAVALPDDDLCLAVVDEADTFTWREFAERMRTQIELARSGRDQAHEAVTVSLTSLQSFGLRDATPVVVAPAVGTLYLSEVQNRLVDDSADMKVQKAVIMTLSFDHRVINGVGAAAFLNSVRDNCENIESLISG